MRELCALGFDAYGCDLGEGWKDGEGQVWDRPLPATEWADSERLAAIGSEPYRLPYPDSSFDAVVSDQVMEHAQNKDEVFREILRVLKPGGHSIHLFPSKWIVKEPHIYVPFASWFWPRIPRWWFALWALVGVRNEFQTDKTWREVVELNASYCRAGLHYITKPEYEHLARKTGGRISWPSRMFYDFHPGKVAKAVRMGFPADLAVRFKQRVMVVAKPA